MLKSLFSALHFVPLFLISIMIVFSFFQRKSRFTINLSPYILLLSAIGVSTSHQVHHGVHFLGSCYFCFGYAAALVYIACRMLFSKSESSATA